MVIGIDMYRYVIPARSAQGDGGSFKDRKPNKERLAVGNQKMADRIHRWTDQWLELQAVHLILHPSMCGSVEHFIAEVVVAAEVAVVAVVAVAVAVRSKIYVYIYIYI